MGKVGVGSVEKNFVVFTLILQVKNVEMQKISMDHAVKQKKGFQKISIVKEDTLLIVQNDGKK